MPNRRGRRRHRLGRGRSPGAPRSGARSRPVLRKRSCLIESRRISRSAARSYCFLGVTALAADHDIIAAFRLRRRRRQDKAAQKCGNHSQGQSNQKRAIRQTHASLRVRVPVMRLQEGAPHFMLRFSNVTGNETTLQAKTCILLKADSSLNHLPLGTGIGRFRLRAVSIHSPITASTLLAASW